MSARYHQFVASALLEDLPPSTRTLCRAVLHALAALADDDGLVWPALTPLARSVGASERAVGQTIALLVDRGWLTSQRRTGPVPVYKINLAASPARTTSRRCIATGRPLNPASEQRKRRPIPRPSWTSTRPGGAR